MREGFLLGTEGEILPHGRNHPVNVHRARHVNVHRAHTHKRPVCVIFKIAKNMRMNEAKETDITI